MKIANRVISKESAPLVIAEIGINHGGDISIAREMVVAAKEAGAEIVKFQSHVIEDEMSGHAKTVIPGNAQESIFSIMEQCALTENEEWELKQFVEASGMIFLSTPFSRAAADRLERMGVSAYKIGSGECNNYPLVQHIARFGKPIILSTGMNSIETIRPAVEIMRQNEVPFALLHCTNVYPTPPELVRLNAMLELQEAFPDGLIGLSDHTTTNHACLAATALGASILERHFTDTYHRTGPDISCSMDKEALRQLIEGSSMIAKMRGGGKGMVDAEIVTSEFAFASVVTTKPIMAGEQFSDKNIWVKRPGTGSFHAKHYWSLIGKTCAKDLAADHQLESDDVL